MACILLFFVPYPETLFHLLLMKPKTFKISKFLNILSFLKDLSFLDISLPFSTIADDNQRSGDPVPIGWLSLSDSAFWDLRHARKQTTNSFSLKKCKWAWVIVVNYQWKKTITAKPQQCNQLWRSSIFREKDQHYESFEPENEGWMPRSSSKMWQ